MPPAFYDPSFPPSILSAASSPKFIAPNSEPRLPTLPVVLGLIGVFLFITLIASISICIFRGHLFLRTERIQDEEAALYVKDVNVTDPASPLSVTIDDEALVEYVPNEPETKKLALRPFFLNPGGSRKPQLRELLLPRLQQVRYHQIVNHSVAAETRHRSFPLDMLKSNATDLPRTNEDGTKQMSLKISSSSPAILGHNETFINLRRTMPDEQRRSALRNPKLVEQISGTFPLISSSDSTSSAYTQESVSSSLSIDSRPWEYDFNNPGDDLFWRPESPAPSGSTTPETPPATPTLILAAVDPVHSQAKIQTEHPVTDSLIKHQLFKTTHLQRHAGPRHLPSRKRNAFFIATYKRASALPYKIRKTRIQEMLRSVKSCKLYIQASTIDFVSTPLSTPLPICKGPGSDCIDYTGKSGPDISSFPSNKSSLCPSFSSHFSSRTRAGKKAHGSPMKTSAKKNPFASSVRRPLGTITNLLPRGTKRSPKLFHAAPRPVLQLNGVPADELAFTAKPSRYNRHTSPPRNPVLLSTRWAPRPAVPPVTITVFAKNRSASSSKYPGRRVTLTPPAGTSLAELRGSIERALGHEVRALRGMVFVGRRSMFLPLLTERFYVQWVKERVREGGIGVVQAWHY